MEDLSFRRVRPFSVFRRFFFKRRPTTSRERRILPFITHVEGDKEAITARQAIRRMFTFVIMSGAYGRKRYTTFPLHTSVDNDNYVASARRPFIQVIKGRRACALFTYSIRTTRKVMVDHRAYDDDRIVITVIRTIHVYRRVIALCFHFVFLRLTSLNFTYSRNNCVPTSDKIMRFSSELMYPSIVKDVIRERRHFRIRVFRRIRFAMSVAKHPMILNFNNIYSRASICR